MDSYLCLIGVRRIDCLAAVTITFDKEVLEIFRFRFCLSRNKAPFTTCTTETSQRLPVIPVHRDGVTKIFSVESVYRTIWWAALELELIFVVNSR
ncbi:unnamed protein product [Protopolystoma xenopodis]|uniref:Uncharacterized protein n=1 Tax=Protopolystoma xenopodis TaxID=117903 RepID=A0A3S5A1J3_9PLAT|nr:unnamed protein product [Protopolystoma xenopodis]